MSKRNFFKMFSIFSFVLLILFTSVCGTFSVTVRADDGTPLFTIKFFDVGQADCIFMYLPNGKTMLIDAGDMSALQHLEDENLPSEDIDYIVTTHPDADHIKAMPEIFDKYFVNEQIIMPDKPTSTKLYNTMMSTIKSYGYTIHYPNLQLNSRGKYDTDVIIDEPELNLKAEILSPFRTFSTNNNSSVVIKITYNENTFMFTGDAEQDAERYILKNYSEEFLDCDVLKCGHHGSNTSSSIEFLQALTPKYAVISCGENNKYGHPNAETIANLENMETEIYRTDLSGTITCMSNGTNITFDGTSPGDPAPSDPNKYVGNFLKWQIDSESELIDNKIYASYANDNLSLNYITRGDGANTVIRKNAQNVGYTIASNNWHDGAGSKYWLIKISTYGFYDVYLSANARTSNAGPKYFDVEYSLDGQTWKKIADFSLKSASAQYSIVFDDGETTNTILFLPKEAENNSTVFIRFLLSSNERCVTTEEGNDQVYQYSYFELNKVIFHGARRPYLNKVMFKNLDGSVYDVMRIANGKYISQVVLPDLEERFFIGWNDEQNIDGDDVIIDITELPIERDVTFVPVYTGDVDGSGTLDENDVTEVLEYLTEERLFSDNQIFIADFDFEDDVTLLDAYLIYNNMDN